MLAVNFAISGIKKLGLNKTYLPFCALLLPAIAGTIYAAIQGLPIVATIAQGLTIGAASMGAYNVVESVKKKQTHKKIIKNNI